MPRPRIRSLKPEHTLNFKVGALSDKAYRTWIGLICYADDEGRSLYRPEELKARLFGFQPKTTLTDIHTAISELEGARLVRSYAVNGQSYLALHDWPEHQRVSHPTPSRLPAPPVDIEQKKDNSGNLPNAPESSGSLANAPESSASRARGSDLIRSGSDQIRSGKKHIHGASPPNGFDALWALHPGEKGSKLEAEKAYRHIKPPEDAIEAMRRQVAYKTECDRRGVFCAKFQHLHRWLKGRRWEDEIPPLPESMAERLWREAQEEKRQ